MTGSARVQRESLILSAEEKRATAFHEGGHAGLSHCSSPRRSSAQGHDPAPGHGPRRDVEPAAGAPHVLAGSSSRTRSGKAMGGVVAEEDRLQRRQQRCGRRFEQSTSIARRMVREAGMSDRVGPMAWSSQQQVFLGEDLMSKTSRAHGATLLAGRGRAVAGRGGRDGDEQLRAAQAERGAMADAVRLAQLRAANTRAPTVIATRTSDTTR